MKDKLTITLGGQNRDLFMSYALLNRLAAKVGETVDFAQVYVNPGLQMELIKMALSSKGTTPDEIDLDQLELTREDGEQIVGWIGEHVIDFFIKGVEAATKATDAQKDRLKETGLGPFLSGLESSPMEMPSAGPTESAQVA